VLNGWPASNAIDDNPNTDYSSTMSPSAANVQGAYLEAWLPAPQSVTEIRLTARVLDGQVLAFPLSYDVYISSSASQAQSQWMQIGTYTTQPDANGEVILELAAPTLAGGVKIVPNTLGVDNYGGHYFQLAEVSLASGRVVQDTPTIYPMGSAYSNDVLPGWLAEHAIDGNLVVSYGSNIFSTTLNDRGTYLAAWTATDGPQVVSDIFLYARMLNGQALAFPQNYQIYLADPHTQGWNFIGNFSQQPDASGLVDISLPVRTLTNGILIVPTKLGQDNYGGYYFQLAEVQLAKSPDKYQ
jgi:hypothetical protein